MASSSGVSLSDDCLLRSYRRTIGRFGGVFGVISFLLGSGVVVAVHAVEGLAYVGLLPIALSLAATLVTVRALRARWWMAHEVRKRRLVRRLGMSPRLFLGGAVLLGFGAGVLVVTLI